MAISYGIARAAANGDLRRAILDALAALAYARADAGGAAGFLLTISAPTAQLKAAEIKYPVNPLRACANDDANMALAILRDSDGIEVCMFEFGQGIPPCPSQ